MMIFPRVSPHFPADSIPFVGRALFRSLGGERRTPITAQQLLQGSTLNFSMTSVALFLGIPPWPFTSQFTVLAVGLFSSLLLGHVPTLQADVILSEMMAANRHTLADETGAFPDWVELQNTGPDAVALDGWHLTDTATNLTRWTFPAVTLPTGGFLVVFASGRDRTQDISHLHTNFRLDADGGYVGLVKPDGVTVASAFDDYPKLKADGAFGRAESRTNLSLLIDVAPQVLIPTSADQLSLNWTQPDFSPGPGWFIGTAPPSIGFDTSLPANAPANLARSGTATQSSTLSGFTASLGINRNLRDFTHTAGNDPNATWTLDLHRRVVIHSMTLRNRTSCCGSRLRDITAKILDTDKHTVLFESDLLNPENTGYVYPNGPDHIDVILPDPKVGQFIQIQRQSDPDLSGSRGQGNGDEASVLSLGEVEVIAQELGGYQPFVRTDLKSEMLGRNSSAFVRLPFLVQDPKTLASLSLKIRYDDGFVAYLNGIEVVRRSAPSSTQWDSMATRNREPAIVLQPEFIDLAGSLSNMQTGMNVFSFHVLNSSIDDGNLLLQPELSATRINHADRAFLVTPTPGAGNQSEFYLGEVRDTRLSVDRGFFEKPFSLEITSSTPAAVIYYSVNGDEPGPGKGIRYSGAITITNTAVIRTRAYLEGWKPTDIDTATYLFLRDVVHQASNWPTTHVPPPGFPATWGNNSVDYGMDPNVISKYSAGDWNEALTQLPSLSIVTEMPNLFDSATGIYANASKHGEEWERPASIEFLEPTNAVPGVFHEACGLRIRGGYSRNPQFIKHSLRIFFRSEYGASKLRFPIFGPEGAGEFDTFDLRTSQNYSWTGGDPHDTLVREEFCEETLGALGQPHRRNRYTHLYLNGQYWGIYEFDERPEASYGATYFGGVKTNYDVVKCGNHIAGFVTEATDGNLVEWTKLWNMTRSMVKDGSNSNYFRILGCTAEGVRNPSLPVMMDVDNLIDYMLEIFYSGDGDATLSSFLGNNQPNNWFGMRDRSNREVGFRFFNSDCEHTLGAPSSQVDRTGPFGGSNEGNISYSNPQWMHEELMRNAEYRVRFGDHVQRHFFDGGALTTEACTNRFLAKTAQINRAIRAYSARWGDAAHEPPLGEIEWQREINSILKNWFPSRSGIVLKQLRLDRLYPSIGSARFSRPGGSIPADVPIELSQTNSGGIVYYTTDGSDPRMVAGAVSLSARPYANTLEIRRPTRIRARVLVGMDWSALIEGLFRPAPDSGQNDVGAPTIVVSPLSQSVVPGGSVTLSVLVTNTAELPLGFRWQANGVDLPGGLSVLNQRSAFLTLSNLQPLSVRYSVWVTNRLRFMGVRSSEATLTFFTDTDADGLADSWEKEFGLDPSQAGDRDLDTDRDGMLNWQENVAGTDPTDPSSRLKLAVVGGEPSATIRFEAVSNRTYTVQYSDFKGDITWLKMIDIAAFPTNWVEVLKDPGSGNSRFYRLITPAQR